MRHTLNFLEVHQSSKQAECDGMVAYFMWCRFMWCRSDVRLYPVLFRRNLSSMHRVAMEVIGMMHAWSTNKWMFEHATVAVDYQFVWKFSFWMIRSQDDSSSDSTSEGEQLLRESCERLESSSGSHSEAVDRRKAGVSRAQSRVKAGRKTRQRLPPISRYVPAILRVVCGAKP